MLSSNVIALNTYYSGLKREQQLYRYLLGNGATRQEASGSLYKTSYYQVVQPFDREYCSDGTGRSSGYDDRTDSGRQ